MGECFEVFYFRLHSKNISYLQTLPVYQLGKDVLLCALLFLIYYLCFIKLCLCCKK